MRPVISEASWQSRVVDYARLIGLRVFHSGDSRRDTSAGWPDLFCVGPEGALAIELKAANGRVRPEQKEWLDALNAAGVPAIVARPDEWPMVRADLDRIAGRA